MSDLAQTAQATTDACSRAAGVATELFPVVLAIVFAATILAALQHALSHSPFTRRMRMRDLNID